MPEAPPTPVQVRVRVDSAFEAMESTPASKRFRWAYILTGLAWCILSAGPMACQEAGDIGLGVAVLVSALIVWPVLKPLWRQPLLILIVVWGAWICLSLLWSPVPRKGLWDVASLRFAWTIPAMWPLMRDRPKFIAAMVLGFFLGNLSQLSLWCGHHFNIHALAYKEFSPGNRNPGWWTHPAEAGNILVGALGLHLPAALMGTGRTRWIAVGGCVVTWAGMIATGTRGAWLAGLALMLVVCGVAIFSGRWKWRSVRWGLAVAAVVGVVGWVTLGDFISRRAQTGITEVQNALNHGDYQSDTGGRIKLAQLALEMFEQHPIVGAGAGSFQPYAEKRLREEGADMQWWADRPGSAHNTWLHIAATIGLIGVALAAAIVWAALRGAFEGLWPTRLGTYAAGPAFALIGMLLTTPFDVPYVNSVPAAFICALLGLCLMGRPREKGSKLAGDPDLMA